MLNGFGKNSKISPSSMMPSPVTHLSQATMPRNKDNRWLEVEVCREFLRNTCSRPDEECKFAHPAPHLNVKAQTVISCYDSLKGNCRRDECKYYHPTVQIAKQIQAAGKLNQTFKQAMLLLPQHQILQNQLLYQPQYQLYPQYNNNNLLYQYGALTQPPALLNRYAPAPLAAALLSSSSTVTQGFSNRKRSIGDVADTWPPTTLWETPSAKRQTMAHVQYRDLMAGAPVYMQQYTPQTIQQPTQTYQGFDANFNGVYSQPPPGF